VGEDNSFGTIQFLDSSTGGTARIVVDGGTFTISGHTLPGVTVGSIEGTGGFVFLGGNKLTVGGNGLSTNFSGDIGEDFSPLAGGSLAKVGTGTLTLGGANTYTGGTTVSAGALILQQNGQSSQTGTGNVVVSAGTLGGDGIGAGNVTIGNNSGPRAILAPSFSDEILSSFFTAKKKLTFRSDGDFVCQVNADNITADKVNARGVAISAGSTFSLTQVGTGQMAIGTTFILINNTANTPISGTFAGIPEGAEIAFGDYIWKFTYSGGTGNDFSGEILNDLSP
jgi:autotransporter-associated beta strand protein